jgi:SAM-dependent methyltransferase
MSYGEGNDTPMPADMAMERKEELNREYGKMGEQGEPYRELLLGCGHERRKLLPGPRADKWHELTTLDINPEVQPDLVCDLNSRIWCAAPLTSLGEKAVENAPSHLKVINSDFFDEIHAYEVLEHLGAQGYVDSFFNTFAEIYRILKPGGYLLATTPSRYSAWLFGDPGHRRVVIQESLVFLDREKVHINRQRHSPLSDYNRMWPHDFKVCESTDNHVRHVFALKAMKPVREFP